MKNKTVPIYYFAVQSDTNSHLMDVKMFKQDGKINAFNRILEDNMLLRKHRWGMTVINYGEDNNGRYHTHLNVTLGEPFVMNTIDMGNLASNIIHDTMDEDEKRECYSRVFFIYPIIPSTDPIKMLMERREQLNMTDFELSNIIRDISKDVKKTNLTYT